MECASAVFTDKCGSVGPNFHDIVHQARCDDRQTRGDAVCQHVLSVSFMI